MRRHAAILRDLAHELAPAADREDRPPNAAAAQARVEQYLDDLAAAAPRQGLGAATGASMDDLIARYGRYGAHLFPCFDDARFPATTNALEGFFGRAKRLERHAVGTGSTASSVLGNLGAAVVMAWSDWQSPAARARLDALVADPAEFRTARVDLTNEEAPTTRRRSMVRSLDRHLDTPRQRRLSPTAQPPDD